MNSTITDQRYQIEKATCALTFDQIRLRRAMTSLPAHQATASSGSQSPMQRERAMRHFPFTDDLGVTIEPPKRVAGSVCIGLINDSAPANRTSLAFLVFRQRSADAHGGLRSTPVPPECARAIGRNRACGPSKPGPRRTATRRLRGCRPRSPLIVLPRHIRLHNLPAEY